MKEFTIDIDDARQMTELSRNAYVGFVVEKGPYKGLNYTAVAAAEYTGPLLAALVAVEESLEAANAESMNGSFFDRQYTDMEIMLSDETNERLMNISKINKFASGMNQNLHVRCTQYMLDRAMYQREIASKRLYRTCSTLSSARTFSRYASYFEKETLAMEFNQISSIIHELSNSTNKGTGHRATE